MDVVQKIGICISTKVKEEVVVNIGLHIHEEEI